MLNPNAWFSVADLAAPSALCRPARLTCQALTAIVLCLGSGLGLNTAAHAQSDAPTGEKILPAAPTLALKGLRLVAQDPSQAKAAPAPAARTICRPLPTTPAQESIAGVATPDSAATPAAQAIQSTLPESLLPLQAVRDRLQGRIGQKVDGALTRAIIDDVVAVLNQQSRYLMDVYFPEQSSSNGILTLVIRPARLGKVIAQGQQYHSAEDIACRIRLQAGEPVDLQVLADDVAQLNSTSSWRRTAPPEFKPGEQPGSTDIVLNSRDEKPLRFSLGMDNTGTRATGQGRWHAGVSIGNFLGHFDHQFDYTLTSAYNSSRLNQHSFSYQLPLESQRRLTARFDYSKSDVLLENIFRAEGTNQIASLEWAQPLPLPQGLRFGQNLSTEGFYGVEYKRIGNALAFGQIPISNNTPTVLQAFMGVRAQWQDGLGNNQLSTRVTYSPGRLINHNDLDSYRGARAGAEPGYWRLNASYGKQVSLPANWALSLNANGQYAPRPLISSERFTLSGVGGVRGYYQDTLTADAGLTFSAEVQSPRQSFEAGRYSGQWYLIGFLDAGRSWNASQEFNADLNKTDNKFSLVSHGVGLRVESGNQSSLRLDLARRHFGLETESRWFLHAGWQLAY